MSAPPDDVEFLNNFIATMDETLSGVAKECDTRDIPKTEVSMYLVLSMASMSRLLKVMHTLKAQSFTIEMLRTSINQLKNSKG